MYVTINNGTTYRIDLNYDNIRLYNEAADEDDDLSLAVRYYVDGIPRRKFCYTFEEACVCISNFIAYGSVDPDSSIEVYITTHPGETHPLFGKIVLKCYVAKNSKLQ